MKRILFSSTVAVMTLFSTSHILAADYDYGVVTKSPEQAYTDVEFGSGWYLRGDITFNSRGRSENTVAAIGDSYDSFNVQSDYDDVIGVRAGFGYQYSPYLRLEATAAGNLRSEFDGIRAQTFGGSRNISLTDSEGNTLTDNVSFDSNGVVINKESGVYQGSTIAPIYGTDTVDAEYNVSSFIASGYIDIPVSDRFTPYVGGGLGFSRVNYSETRHLVCTPDSEASCRYPTGGTGEQVELDLTRDEQYWAFSYQLSLGTAIKLSDRTSLDLGYTYLNIDGGDDLSYENGLAINDDGFSIHQGHVGIRYDIY